jgi:apolipoprotein D and lipocalin family protein
MAYLERCKIRMLNYPKCIVIGILAVLLIVTAAMTEERETKGEPLKTVGAVNLDRYVGLWYEIAKIPNRFQKKCVSKTTAFYQLREDGRLDVLNRCLDIDGNVIEAKGIAKIVDDSSNAKLKVSFVKLLGIRLFWGDYWIIGLGENYEYALVGTPSRKYGWILGRTPSLPQETLDSIFDRLRNQGYNPQDFVLSPQVGNTSGD